MGLYGRTVESSSVGKSNFKLIFNHRNGQEKTRETLSLKDKLSFGRGQGQVGLYGGLMGGSSAGIGNFRRTVGKN